jgi:hypothetical protein
LGGDVGLSQLVAARAGAAPFKQVAREKADVAAECRFGNGELG